MSQGENMLLHHIQPSEIQVFVELYVGRLSTTTTSCKYVLPFHICMY